MKKILFLLLLVFSIAICSAIESDLTADDAQGLENFIKTNMPKEYDEIKSGAISDLSKAKFYRVSISHNYTNHGQIDEIIVVNFQGEYSELKNINDLTKFIDPSYTINSLEDTEAFAMVAKELFPGWFPSFRDGIYQVENEWFFIYNKFFDDKDGIVVTVDDAGKITAIETRGGIQ